MCYGVARPEPSGREFAGFESVEGGVRGILGFGCQALGVRCLAVACNLKSVKPDGSCCGVRYTCCVSLTTSLST
jgi:hypothetical protein